MRGCIPFGPAEANGRSIRTAAPVPFPGPVHPAPQDPSSSVNSGASVHRSPSAIGFTISLQGSAPSNNRSGILSPNRQLQTRRTVRHRLRGIHLPHCPLTIRPQPRRCVPSLLPPSPLQRDFSCGKTSPVNHSQSRLQAITRRDGPNDEKGSFPDAMASGSG